MRRHVVTRSKMLNVHKGLLVHMAMLKVITAGPIGTNCYLLTSGTDAALIDAAPESAGQLLAALRKNGAALRFIITTHGHWDHIGCNAELKEATQAVLCCHADDEERLRNPEHRIEPSKPDRLLSEGDMLHIGDIELVVLHTPGHTPGSICLLSGDTLFTGDTLFAGTHGRTDLHGGDADAMEKSLGRLAQLPPQTRVYPGHGDATTIGEEAWLRDFLQ